MHPLRGIGALTLQEAGRELGLSPATLRSQIRNGVFTKAEAKLIGKTWTLTPRAVERYRAQRLGKRGRPAKEKA